MKGFVIARIPIPTIDKDQPLSLAIDLMDSGTFNSIPVIDDGKFVGIVGVRGVLERIWSERVRTLNLSSLYVSSVMETGIPMVSMDSDLIEACNLMVKNNLMAIPIVDDGKPVGMIFEDDIPRLLLNSNNSSDEIMDYNVKSVDMDSSVLHVRSLMLKEGLRFIPIIKNGKFLGSIYDRDLINLLMFIQDKISPEHRDARIRGLRASDLIRFNMASFYGAPPIGRIARVILERGSPGAIALREDKSIFGVVHLKSFVKLVSKGVL
ncbi:MAG: CBS domain-containing protein [Candidatus Methanomethylicia archaeon]